ncbi:MAG: thymidine phosphorylase [Clostridia bacterium]|nr:thymidine phosphorylase [Clostridia bacterium]
MNIVEVIESKRDGYELTKEQISYFVNGVMSNAFDNAQIGALLMAITNRGMSGTEAYNYAKALAESGEQLRVSEHFENCVDKHSTGGVSDACTLVVLPVLATLGFKVAKYSTKNVGASFGTLDRLSVFDGYIPSPDYEKFYSILDNVGISVIGGDGSIIPADKKLYKIREITGTVPSIPLVACSIMAKKIAMGSKTVVLDVKCGEGSLLKDINQAERLAKLMVDIGKLAGIKTTAILSNLDQPLGRAIGPKLEVMEALKMLSGKYLDYYDTEIYNLCKEMVIHLLMSSGKDQSRTSAGEKFDEIISSGKAFYKLRDMVKAHGGDVSPFKNIEELVPDANTIYVVADKAGYVYNVDTKGLYQAINIIGATTDGGINRNVGVEIVAREGEKIKAGDKLAKIYYSISDPNFASAVTCIRKCFRIEKRRPELNALVYKIIY